MNDFFRHRICPILAAIIWGTAFAVQKYNTLGTISFGMARSFVAVVFLFFMVFLVQKGHSKGMFREDTPENTKKLWIGGIVCGLLLAPAMCLQQVGLDRGVEAGKAAFLTALYVVLVPIGGKIFMKKKIPPRIWISVAVAVGALYLLCVKKGFTIRTSDIWVITCAIVYSAHILCTGYFTEFCNGIKMSCIQFGTTFLVLLPVAILTEHPTWAGMMENFLPIMYVGIFSSGIAFTLQIIAQKGVESPEVTVLLSTESVFGVIAGAILCHEVLSMREYWGCALMFCAVIGSQLDFAGLFRKLKGNPPKEDKPEIEMK